MSNKPVTVPNNSEEYFSLHYSSYVIGDSDRYLDTRNGTSKWKGPRRVCIFCTTAIILPSLLISVPLLMRFVIYGSNSYVLHPSDMMILDQRISTTWCEAETVTVNTSFTAYVTNGEPTLFKAPTTLSIDQHMKIPDDQKEYWGLYLLPGSTFTIKTCAKFKGGTLLIVRGNNHMQYCAYVGENDSAGNSDDVSGSTSFESVVARKNQGDGNGGVDSQEKAKDDLTILSKLKSFLQTHPSSRGKIQKTLEDWMLLNRSSNANSKEEVDPLQSSTQSEVEVTTRKDSSEAEPGKESGIEHGTIRRRRQAVDIRRDTESGEDGAFEDDTVHNSTKINDDDFILPHPLQNSNASILDLLKSPQQTPDSIWKEQHSQHSGILNISITGEDGSASESESSFSSSEEALLKCEGIIASFKIPHEEECIEEGDFDSLNLTKPIPGLHSNAFRFEVVDRDYYYFIFGSENEKETNLVRTKFELQKVEYQLPDPVKNCTGVKECQISFGFASSEKVVVKLPQPVPEANSNVVFMAETVCKPRSHLYLIFVILVPVSILLFAFR